MSKVMVNSFGESEAECPTRCPGKSIQDEVQLATLAGVILSGIPSYVTLQVYI